MGLGLLYTRLALRPQDDIFTTGPSTRRTRPSGSPALFGGSALRRSAPASAGEIVNVGWRRAVGPRTRVVALIGEPQHGREALLRGSQTLPERVLLCVDGVHGLAAEAETRAFALRARSRPACQRVSLRPPARTGVPGRVLVREAGALDDPASSMTASGGAGLPAALPVAFPTGAFLTPGGFHSSSTAGARWLEFHEAIGRGRSRRGFTVARLRQGSHAHVTIRTPGARSLSAGLVLDVEGREPADVVASLADCRIVASVTPYAPPPRPPGPRHCQYRRPRSTRPCGRRAWNLRHSSRVAIRFEGGSR